MALVVQDLRLVARTGPLKGVTFEIPEGRMSLGRDAACELRVDDPKVSRVHGYFERTDGKITYSDNDSTNGSLVNGTIVRRHELRPGDVIQIGGVEFALLDQSDFDSINYVECDPKVTTSVTISSMSGDALAAKLDAIFDYYKDFSPERSEVEQVELVKTQRLLNNLKALYRAGTRMSQLLPMDELLEIVASTLFDVFAGAENVVILLYDESKSAFVPRLSCNREGSTSGRIQVSSTVLDRAIRDRATLIASDIEEDSGLASSDSLLSMRVKSVICAPLITGDRILGALYLDNRVKPMGYDELDAQAVTAFANQAATVLENARLTDNLQASYRQLLQALVRAIEAKDSYTLGHTQRVKHYALGIAQEMGFEGERLQKLGTAADLHDIGKIGVKERIINKPGNLTDTEFSSIKAHVEVGERILEPVASLADILPWIRGHHERWDGSGYPDGLKGEEIPIEARILAVADAFDAMTSQRSYNQPLSFDEGLRRLKKVSDVHFDPKVVKAFARFMRQTLHRTLDPASEVERT